MPPISYRWTKQDDAVHGTAGCSDIYEKQHDRVTPYYLQKFTPKPGVGDTIKIADSESDLFTKSGSKWSVKRLQLPSAFAWRRISSIDALRDTKTLGDIAKAVAKNCPTLANSGSDSIDSRIFNYWDNTKWRGETIDAQSTTVGWTVGLEKNLAKLEVPRDIYVPWTKQPPAVKKTAPASSGTPKESTNSNTITPLPASFEPVRQLSLKFAAIRDSLISLQKSRKNASTCLCQFGGVVRTVSAMFSIARYALKSPVGMAPAGADSSAWEDRKEKYRKAEKAFMDVEEKSNDLYRAWGKKVTSINPIAAVPSLLEAIQSKGKEAINLINDPANTKLIETFLKDTTATKSFKRDTLAALKTIIEQTLEEVSQTEVHENLAGAIDIGFSTDRDNLIAALQGTGSMIATTVGNLPGPDSLSVAMAKILATWQMFKVKGESAKLTGILGKLASRIVTAARFDAAETAEFNTHVKAKNWMDCESMIGNKLQQGKALSSFIGALNILQLASALQGIGDPSKDVIQAFADLSSAAINTFTGTIALADKFTAAIKADAAYLGRMKCFVNFCGKAIEELAVPISTSIAVLSIISGSITFLEGLKEGDAVKMTVGGLSVASGVFIAVGVLCSIPGAQPIGVVLAAVATAISLFNAAADALKPALTRAANSYLKFIEESASTWDGKKLVETLNLQTEFEALKKALETANPYTYLELYDDASMKSSRTSRLIAAGIPSDLAKDF